jgi:hypothetical protein
VPGHSIALNALSDFSLVAMKGRSRLVFYPHFTVENC